MKSSRMAATAATVGILASGLMTGGCGAQTQAPATVEQEAPAVDLQTPPAEAVLDPQATVATVNGKTITQADVEKEIQTMMQRLGGRVPPERLAQMMPNVRQQSVDAIVTRTLLLQAVEAEKIEVTETDLSEAIGKIEKQMAANQVELAQMLEANKMTMDEFKAQLTTDLRINKLLEKQTADLARPTGEELEAFYKENPEQFEQPESVSAHHILVQFDESDDDAAKAEKKKKIEAIREKIVAGADFEEAAKADSDCPSKAQGGDLGTFRRGQMVPQFEEAAFTQATNEVGPVVETRFGYHIIRVDDHTKGGKVDLAEVSERLGDFLLNQKRQTAAQAYVQKLRDEAKISYEKGFEPEPAPAPMM